MQRERIRFPDSFNSNGTDATTLDFGSLCGYIRVNRNTLTCRYKSPTRSPEPGVDRVAKRGGPFGFPLQITKKWVPTPRDLIGRSKTP